MIKFSWDKGKEKYLHCSSISWENLWEYQFPKCVELITYPHILFTWIITLGNAIRRNDPNKIS